MSMNRLRNVAVRMRPPKPQSDTLPAGSDDLPADEVAQVSNSMAPRRVVVSRPDTDQKRQIWDIEDEVTEASARTPVQTPQPSAQAVPSPAPSRAKTRILGFHAEEIAPGPSDDIDQGPVYPAGFLVVVDGPGRGAFFAVTTRVSTIGRGADQDIPLDFGDESISRSGHASVMYDAELNRFFLGHGNKANAVRRNDKPVLATEEMSHGDDIRIGKTTMRFHAFCGPDFTWDEVEDD